MQVNQSTSPNFGKLKIVKTPALESALKKENIETLSKIAAAGEKLNNTKFFDIVLKTEPQKDVLKAVIVSPLDAYFGSFSTESCNVSQDKNTKSLLFNDICRIARYTSDNQQEAFYNVWGLGSYIYEKASDIATLSQVALEMDKAAVQKYNERIALEKSQREYDAQVASITACLIDKFGE